MSTKYDRPVGAAVKDISISAGGLGSIPGLVNSDTVGNVSPSLRRFCVTQALCRGDGLRLLLHASA